MNPNARRVLFSRASEAWSTPEDLYRALNEEFRFTLPDPCPLREPAEAGLPLFGTDGLSISWVGHRVFINPPFGRGMERWLEKAQEADLAVVLAPARTDTRAFHRFAPLAEVRFLKGRLHFSGSKTPAPFPTMLYIFRRTESAPGGAQ